MPNIKSAIKRVSVIEHKTLRNKMVKSATKTAIKKFDAATASKTATYSISDYETENTHTAGSRTIERATAEIDRHTEGIRFPPLLQALRHQEGGRHEHLHRVRTFVEK